MLSALVVIDYQNIHLTAHDLWAPAGTAKHETLVHPLHFANGVLSQRNQTLLAKAGEDAGDLRAELAGVAVYRGMPSNKEDPTAYRRSMAQRSEWTRDPRVQVTYRPLKYFWTNGERRAKEKGVDVLVALHLVRAAREATFDVVILASHDTDLEPAVDEAVDQDSTCQVETAGWKDAKRLHPKSRVWHTFATSAQFVSARDRKNYD
ncbi:PIN domain-containing protein [Parenemella sanctibonifatiensis]|uniref:NYN domain-containing protein n=1 Tax=Parenemella sanctibonifatiensis TaxID=2016505 RepID=A0A255E785_9ACTN|nr:NYN domain-containing protein [Parenemella sanctibonifatiensis]OYN83983.1 NYN domain-containing protein [Parenemella sanctibonifatiensis]